MGVAVAVTMAVTMTVTMTVTMAMTSGCLFKSFILYLDCCCLDSEIPTLLGGFLQN